MKIFLIAVAFLGLAMVQHVSAVERTCDQPAGTTIIKSPYLIEVLNVSTELLIPCEGEDQTLFYARITRQTPAPAKKITRS